MSKRLLLEEATFSEANFSNWVAGGKDLVFRVVGNVDYAHINSVKLWLITTQPTCLVRRYTVVDEVTTDG